MLSRPWRIPGHPSNAAFSNGIMVGVYSCLAAVLAFGMGQDLSQETAMWERAVAAIDRAPSDRLFLMGSVTGIPPDRPDPLLQQLGLTRTSETCATYASHSIPFRVCTLKRIPERLTP